MAFKSSSARYWVLLLMTSIMVPKAVPKLLWPVQEFRGIGDAPAAEAGNGIAAQAGGVPIVKLGAREEIIVAGIHSFCLQGDAARRVTGATMAEAFDEIGAAIPHRVLAFGRREADIAEKQKVPYLQRPAHIQRRAYLAWLIGLGY